MYIYLHIRTYIRIFIYRYRYIYVYIYIYIYVYSYIYTHTHMCTCIYTYICIYSICTYVNIGLNIFFMYCMLGMLLENCIALQYVQTHKTKTSTICSITRGTMFCSTATHTLQHTATYCNTHTLTMNTKQTSFSGDKLT